MVTQSNRYFDTLIALSVVSVVFLVPSVGLSTLTIPDESYGSTSTLLDIPHISKRATEGAEKNIYAAFGNISVGSIHALEQTVAFGALLPSAIASSQSNIRGPPEACA